MVKKLLGGLFVGLMVLGAVAQPASAHAETYYGDGYYNYNGYNYTAGVHPVGYYGAQGWNNGAWNRNWGTTYRHMKRGGIVLTQTVDFYVAPSVSAPIYACMQPGTTFTLLGRGGGWAKVRSKWGTVGYIPDAEYYY